mmetsp:Transcript_5276/g.10728  ORF Transcript_5276/g.10728 Transcript_5276/m.10728 type:complete len:217 (-) Transcript_5276:1152-1802(-)
MNSRTPAQRGIQQPQRNPLVSTGGQRLGSGGAPLAGPMLPSNGTALPATLGSRPQRTVGGKAPQPLQRPGADADPDDGANAVAAFLRDAGLQMYAYILIQNGCDDMETLLAIKETDLRDLGVPAYHAARLQKQLQEVARKGAADDIHYLDDTHPVVAFLLEVGLSEYAHVLLQHGFDDMETLLEMSDFDMQEFGIKRCHAIKLTKRLREYSDGTKA